MPARPAKTTRTGRPPVARRVNSARLQASPFVSMPEPHRAAADEPIRAPFEREGRESLERTVHCAGALHVRPCRDRAYCLGGRRSRAGRHDVPVHARVDEVVRSSDLIGGDHGQSVSEPLVHDETPGLVEGGDDERIDFGVEVAEIIAADMPEEANARVLGGRLENGRSSGPSPAIQSSPPSKRAKARRRTSRPLRSMSRPTNRNRVLRPVRIDSRCGGRSGASAVIGAITVRAGSTPISARSRAWRVPYARHASDVRMKYFTQGSASRRGHVGWDG